MNWGKKVNAGAGCQGYHTAESKASPRGDRGWSPRPRTMGKGSSHHQGPEAGIQGVGLVQSEGGERGEKSGVSLARTADLPALRAASSCWLLALNERKAVRVQTWSRVLTHVTCTVKQSCFRIESRLWKEGEAKRTAETFLQESR